MHRCTSWMPLLALALAVTTPVAAAAQQEPTPEQLREIMARMAELAQPGPEHTRLARFAGSFDVVMRVWPEPGAEPQTVRATSRGEMILGGRFLMLRTSTEAGMFAGEAISIIGFDRRHQEYTLIGLDTQGTYWVSAHGPANAEGTSATLSGTDEDPVFGHTQEYDFVLHFVDDDTLVTEIVFRDPVHTRGGPPFRMLETTARRSGAAQ